MEKEIKEILDNGGKVSFSYKRENNHYMGEAYIVNIISGYSEPNTYVSIGGYSKEFKIDQQSEAIDFFISEVLTEKNKVYKWHEALVEFSKINPYFELEDETDFETFNGIRQKIINYSN